ncbi:MAG: pilin [Candidatus Moraniibacteriota bacterium]
MGQFITCGGLDCSICSLLETTSNIFRWLLGISAILASLFLIIGGVFYLFSQGNKNYFDIAKRTTTYSILGFVFSLIAFISVHTTIWVVTAENNGQWWKFKCVVNTKVLTQNGANSGNSSSNPMLLTEKQDNSSILTNISGLNNLSDQGHKIAIFDQNKLDSENLRQDLLKLESGQQIKFLAGENNLADEEITAFAQLQNGYDNNLTRKYNLDELTKKIQNIINFSRDDGDLTITGSGDLTQSSGTYWGLDPVLGSKLNSIVNSLTKKNSPNLIAYKNARSEGSLNECIDTGGDWKQFQNECNARKQIHGKENINCSQTFNPAMGCQCPESSYLINGVCVKKENINNQNTIKISENPDLCSNVALINRTCPTTRCEGSNLVIYPGSGKDQCVNGILNVHPCNSISSQYSPTCDQMSSLVTQSEKENIAKQNQSVYDQLKDYFDRSNQNNSPDNWGKTANKSGTGNNNSSGDNSGSSNNTSGNRTGSGDRSGSDQTSGKTPNDLGPGNYNPTPSAEELAKCIGFKDGKIPYNGVLVTLLNKDDPTNAKHPSNNASRLFYLDRYGNLVGNAGDKNSGGLKVGPWTKGSGGSTWTPEWAIFNAQTVHTSNSSGSADPWSFKSGAGYRVGPSGEGMNANGTLNPNGKPQGMSGCNMHSGNSRNHSAGCMTMGGNERKGFTNYVKKMATQGGGNIMMAVLPAENTDQNSQTIKSDYCGNMNPEAAVNKFKTLSQYHNYDPMQGY